MFETEIPMEVGGVVFVDYESGHDNFSGGYSDKERAKGSRLKSNDVFQFVRINFL